MKQFLILLLISAVSAFAQTRVDWTQLKNVPSLFNPAAHQSTHQSSGSDPLSGTFGISITGNAGSVTNGLYSNQSYSDPSWLTITKAKVGLGNVENTALSTWTGTVNITTIGTLTAGSVPWARLIDVPSTFTPAAHTQTASTITDFNTAVDARVSANSLWTLSGTDIFYTAGKVGVGTNSPPVLFTVGSAEAASGYITGDRRLTITATKSTGPVGDPTALVDGNTTSDAVTFSNSWQSVTFDFGSPVIVTEVKLYQGVQGTYPVNAKWAASNDGTNFSEISVAWPLKTANPYTDTSLSANTTAYRYYKLQAQYTASLMFTAMKEIEFKMKASGGGVGADVPTSQFAGLTTFKGNVTVQGNATFTGSLTGTLTGNADTVTNGVYTNGSYTDPSWLTINWDKISNKPTTFTPSAHASTHAGGGSDAITSLGVISIISGVRGDPTNSGNTQPYKTLNLKGYDNSVLDFGETTNAAWWIQVSDTTDHSYKYNLALQPIGGNVGIGTATPDAKLVVNLGADGELLHLFGSPGYLGFGAYGANVYVGGGAANLVVGTSTNHALQFQTNNTIHATVTSGGNVGIRTTNPLYALHVRGGDDNTLGIDNDGSRWTTSNYLNNGTIKTSVFWDNTAENFNIYVPTGGIQFGTNGNFSAMTIKSANVGVGISPDFKFQVHGSSYDMVKTNNSDSEHGIAIMRTDIARQFYFSQRNSYDSIAPYGLLLYSWDGSNYHNYMYAKMDGVVAFPAGIVGIDTTTPDASLQIGNHTRFRRNTWGLPVTPDGTISPGERISFYDATGWKTAMGMDRANGIWFQAHTAADAPAFMFFTGRQGGSPALAMSISGNGTMNVGDLVVSGTLTQGGKVTASEAYIQSRGMNLVTNGSGLLGNNTNFPGFTFYTADTHGGGGSFLDTQLNSERQSSELIPVNGDRRYRLSAWAKSFNYEAPGSYIYFGFAPYDIDGNLIAPHYYGRIYGTDTTLAQDLVPGDTHVHLTSAANWLNTNGDAYWTHSLTFWNYTNAKGYKYPPYTYSVNNTLRLSAYNRGAWVDGAISGNDVTLVAPWPADWGTIPAGTPVSNGTSGGTYKYTAAAGVPVPNTWTYYTGTVGGWDTTGSMSDQKFPYGTAYIKLLFLNGYAARNASTVAYSDLWFSELSETPDANGNMTIPGTLFANGIENSGSVRIPIGNGNGILWHESGINYGQIKYDSSNGLQFVAGGNERVRILPNGRMGVGTTDPSQLFEVNGTALLAQVRSNQLSLYESGSNLGSGTLQYMGSGSGSYLKIEAGDRDAWRPVVIGPTGGNLGVGDTAPSERLSVKGNILATLGGGGGGLYFRSAGSNGNTNMSSKLYYEGLISGDGSTETPWGLHVNATAWTWGSDSIYYHGSNHVFRGASGTNGVEAEYGRINKDGLITYGSIQDYSSLEVFGNSYFRSNLYVLNKANNGWNPIAVKNTTGDDSVMDLSYIGAITMVNTSHSIWSGTSVAFTHQYAGNGFQQFVLFSDKTDSSDTGATQFVLRKRNTDQTLALDFINVDTNNNLNILNGWTNGSVTKGNVIIGTNLFVNGSVNISGEGWSFKLKATAGSLHLRNYDDNGFLSLVTSDLYTYGNIKLQAEGSRSSQMLIINRGSAQADRAVLGFGNDSAGVDWYIGHLYSGGSVTPNLHISEAHEIYNGEGTFIKMPLMTFTKGSGTDSGRVLIGTTADDGSNKLQVAGSMSVTGTLTAGTISGSVSGDAGTLDTYHASNIANAYTHDASWTWQDNYIALPTGTSYIQWGVFAPRASNVTITEVACWADTSDAVLQLRNSVNSGDMISGNLTCGSAAYTNTTTLGKTLSSNTISVDQTAGMYLVSGTAKRVSVAIKFTRAY
jgi:hypothetical protein